MNRRRSAFALMELMIVIAVIGILMSMIVAGMRYVGEQNKARATHVTMENFAAILQEYEQKTKLQFTGSVAAGDVTENVNSQTDANGRYGYAVLQTQRALRLALTMPHNRELFARFPSNQQMPLLWCKNVTYWPGDLIKAAKTDTQGFRCITQNANGVQLTAPPVAGADWELTGEHVPLLLDAWGNPIIYVPRPNMVPNSDGPPPIVIDWYSRYSLIIGTGSGRIVWPARAYPAKPGNANNEKDYNYIYNAFGHYQAFLASAGTDGNMGGNPTHPGTGNDNVYSFEK